MDNLLWSDMNDTPNVSIIKRFVLKDENNIQVTETKFSLLAAADWFTKPS